MACLSTCIVNNLIYSATKKKPLTLALADHLPFFKGGKGGYANSEGSE